MMVTAISVSTSGGNQSASGTNPNAEAISEIECPTVNEVTMMISGRSRRNGITRQHRNSRWSAPSRICQKPDTTKRSAAWCQRGSRRTRPGSPWSSNARVAPAGGRKRNAVETFCPSRSTRGRGPGFDDRRDECGELGGGPTLLLRKLRVDEIEPVERMLRVLDAAVHVHAALGAGVPLNGRIGIRDLELFGILGNTELVARHNGDLREQGACGLPAFGASTYVIIGALGRNAHLDGIARAFAHERCPREVRRAGPHAVVHCRMN